MENQFSIYLKNKLFSQAATAAMKCKKKILILWFVGWLVGIGIRIYLYKKKIRRI